MMHPCPLFANNDQFCILLAYRLHHYFLFRILNASSTPARTVDNIKNFPSQNCIQSSQNSTCKVLVVGSDHLTVLVVISHLTRLHFQSLIEALLTHTSVVFSLVSLIYNN